MSQPSLQDVNVPIGGRSFTLRFSVRATLFLKKLWGLEDDREVQARLAKTQDMDGFIDIFWAGLQTHHREMSRDDVLDVLDAAGPDGLASAVTDALAASAPPPDPQ